MGIFGSKKDKKTKQAEEKKDLAQVKDAKKGKKESSDNKKNNQKENKKNKEAQIKATANGFEHIIRPVVSEKASFMGAENKYIFEVEKRANKIEISKAIQSIYGVKPIKINIINVNGKKVRFGRKFGQTKNWKKAIVSLKEGQTINVYEGV